MPYHNATHQNILAPPLVQLKWEIKFFFNAIMNFERVFLTVMKIPHLWTFLWTLTCFV